MKSLWSHILLPKKVLRIMAIFIVATFCLAGGVEAYIFEDDFESGTYSSMGLWKCEEPGDTVTVVAEAAHNSNFGLKCYTDSAQTGGQAWVNTAIAEQKKLYMRAYYYFPADFNVSNYVTLTKFYHTDWNNFLAVTYDSADTLYLYNSVAGEAYGF